jgi:NADH:ubiquinone reductase (non-electrogenic)
VASKQGQYLARRLNAIADLEKDTANLVAMGVTKDDAIKALPPFEHASKGILAYIGSDKAIADFPVGVRLGGVFTNMLWKSAYFSTLFSVRNKWMVGSDWIKKTLFGRDIGRE